MIIFESTFPKDYRQDEIGKILKLTLRGKFCQLVCVPGAGKATVLRLLAHNRDLLKFHLGEKEKSIRFIYLNLLELSNYDEAQLAKFLLLALDEKVPSTNDPLILIKQLSLAVNKLAAQKQTVIFLFDHSDEYQNQLPRSFFQILRNLKSLAKYNFATVFATRRDLKELIDAEILKEFYDFFIDNTVYLKIYDRQAAALMLSQIEQVSKKRFSPAQKENIIAMTFGHAKLAKTVGESVLQENIPVKIEALLAKPIIRATLFELWLFLTAQEQRVLTNIALNKPVEKSDALENLLKFDLIKHINSSAQSNNLTIQQLNPLRPLREASEASNLIFTIPLFEEFVQKVVPSLPPAKIIYDPKTKEIIKDNNVISDLLSPQEYRLLRFLIENQERIVQREEIINAVWPDVQVAAGISDEAIDQMVYRLRQKIEDEPTSPRHLTTVKGRGLRFAP